MPKSRKRKVAQHRPKVASVPKKEHVFVAIPTMDARVSMAVHEFWSALDRSSLRPEFPFVFSHYVLHGIHPHEYARNVLVGEFLKTDASRLWFIDTDMIPTNSSARLLSVDADICAGRMFRFDHDSPFSEREAGLALCAFIKSPNGNGKYLPIAPQPGDPLVQDCDAVGTGSMLIRRHVLEDRRMWLHGDYIGLDLTLGNCHAVDDGHRFAPPVFQTLRKPNGQPLIGEDLEFCKRAERLGYSIKVDLGSEWGHYKPVDLDHVGIYVNRAANRAMELSDEDKENIRNVQDKAKVAQG